MAVDFEGIFKDAIAAATGQLKSGAPEVKNYIHKVLNDHKDALLKLAKQRVQNQISQDDFEAEIDDEKEALVVELKASETIAEKVAQDAVNAAIAVLIAAISKAV